VMRSSWARCAARSGERRPALGIRPDDLAGSSERSRPAVESIGGREDVILAASTSSASKGSTSRGTRAHRGVPVDVAARPSTGCAVRHRPANFAAMASMSGQYDVVIAGGIEHIRGCPWLERDGPGDGPLSPSSRSASTSSRRHLAE